MDKVSILENKGIYSFKIYSEQEELDSFMVKGENTRHFSDGMNRHMVSIL